MRNSPRRTDRAARFRGRDGESTLFEFGSHGGAVEEHVLHGEIARGDWFRSLR